jgi:hypothetical protein
MFDPQEVPLPTFPVGMQRNDWQLVAPVWQRSPFGEQGTLHMVQTPLALQAWLVPQGVPIPFGEVVHCVPWALHIPELQLGSPVGVQGWLGAHAAWTQLPLAQTPKPPSASVHGVPSGCGVALQTVPPSGSH